MTKSHSPLRKREPCLLTPSFPRLRGLALPTQPLHTRPSDCSFSRLDRNNSLESVDVLGLGEAMIDFGVDVSDQLLEEINVSKGGRRLVDSRERVTLCQKLGHPCGFSPGSSLGNTLSAMSQLSKAFGKDCRLGFAGCIGNDTEGRFYSSYLRNQGVKAMDCAEGMDRQTGCVIVMVTSDAQRSFLVDPGEGRLQLTEEIRSSIARSKSVAIEGYLFQRPEAQKAIFEAIRLAKRHNTRVILTTGDADVVKKSRQSMWDAMTAGVDVLLCNRCEAAALLQHEGCCAYEAVKRLGRRCPFVAVTDGSKGSYVICNGVLVTVPPCWTSTTPIDTCGAGDVYAAGLLMGRLLGYDLHRIGRLAARSASSIIVKHGTQLTPDEATEIVADLEGTPMTTACQS